MARRFSWLWPALILLIGVGYQFLVHSAVAGGQAASIRIALSFAPLLALAYWVATRARNKLPWACAVLVAGIAMYALEHRVSWGLAAAYGLPHAAIYLSLLWLFGRTLWHGNEALITRLAHRVHGKLTPGLAAYTRRVTYAWCVFFAAQIVISLTLFVFAPLSIWSLFINFLNFPLLALMFIAEYAYRRLRHSELPHASVMDGIRAFTADKGQAQDAETGVRT